jgi:hypothetical protein
MRKIKWHILSFLLVCTSAASAQLPLNVVNFFTEDSLVTMNLATDLKKLVSEKKLNQYQPATVTCRFPDSSVITEEIRLSARGEFRRTNCFVPSIKFDFSNPTSPRLANLHKLKLVCGCDTRANDERLLLKEFLIYKIYNLVTDMSFRVRMLRINYQDTREKIKPFTQYGFLIEDVDQMAKRNKCYEVEGKAFHTEWTNREQMTLVAIFQYMIGNSDWSIANYHNIKLMRPVTDSASLPYTIPYDFDFCGLVNAAYAAPPEDFPISSVKERYYRGFPRTTEELQAALDIFLQKKDAIINLILGFEPLELRYRNEMISYLGEFYKTISNKAAVNRIFIANARKN